VFLGVRTEEGELQCGCLHNYVTKIILKCNFTILYVAEINNIKYLLFSISLLICNDNQILLCQFS